MRMRVCLGVALGLAGLGAGLPALSQIEGFRFLQPPALQAVGGPFRLRWHDLPQGGIAAHPTAITWYYSPDPLGRQRKRISTGFCDNFERGFLANWRPAPPFAFGWRVTQDRGERWSYLRSDRDAGPNLSLNATDRDVVVSVLVRSRSLRPNYGIGLRVQPDLAAYEVRQEGLQLRVLSAGREIATMPAPEIRPRNWYWYEIGLRNPANKRDVEIRIRVLDEERQRVLVSMDPLVERPRAAGLTRPGLIALFPNADFREIYVDPWCSRWMDGHQNELRWDTSGVPNGAYFIVAELSDGRGRPRLSVSPFQVEVQNPGLPAD